MYDSRSFKRGLKTSHLGAIAWVTKLDYPHSRNFLMLLFRLSRVILADSLYKNLADCESDSRRPLFPEKVVLIDKQMDNQYDHARVPFFLLGMETENDRLSPYCTVYQAELLALNRATNEILR